MEFRRVLFRSTSMGRILLSALSADLHEEWLSHTVLEPRTERTIVSADALRAELDIVAEQRWSLVEEELETGLRSLAVPVRDRDGNILDRQSVQSGRVGKNGER